MWNLDGYELLQIAGRSALIYLFVLVALRLAGKREVGQLTPFDLVVLLLISNAVQNAMTGPDTSVSGGIVAALTLLVLNAIVAYYRQKNESFRHAVDGAPVILIEHGKIREDNLSSEKMTTDELMVALRQHEATKVEEVELAMLEIDGSITVIRKSSDSPTKFFRSRRRLPRHGKRAS